MTIDWRAVVVVVFLGALIWIVLIVALGLGLDGDWK